MSSSDPGKVSSDTDDELRDEVVSVLADQDAHVDDDGRVDITFNHKLRTLFENKLSHRHERRADQRDRERAETEQKRGQTDDKTHHDHKHFHFNNSNKHFRPVLENLGATPRLNVAILIVGSRGDVQPFIALAKQLQAAPYYHRVRLCTHPVFKTFVEENGIEFYSLGGDPEKLMSYMVNNPGVLPSIKTLKAGDVGARRSEISQMLDGAWRGCTEAGNGVDPIKLVPYDENDPDVLLRLPAPFIADAIIANPPAYAHLHIAEKLAVPLHMMFTMPWSPTTEFPHPLTNVDAKEVSKGLANYLSYQRMEYMTWGGLLDIINSFREKTLFLDPVHPAWAHTLFTSLKVPFNYCWSPALIPKPKDWAEYITISGYLFLPLALSYTPDAKLQAFLDAGPPPVYIGFGSIVVDDPDKLSNIVLEAVRLSGVRALVSKGWGNLGGADVPENVFLLGNVPHDWLFPRCSAVVHHGGAGTCATGIALGKPTVIVPFFGDQPFWANMVHRAGAGPAAVPWKKLTAEKLAENIRSVLEPETQARAKEFSIKINSENGAKNAAKIFQSTPQMQNLRCFLCPDRVAVWRVRRTNIQLSSMAAAVLVVSGKLSPEKLKLVRHKRWFVERGAQDPIIGIIGAFGTTMMGYASDVQHLSKDVSSPENSHTKKYRDTNQSPNNSPTKSLAHRPAPSSTTPKSSTDSPRQSTDSAGTLKHPSSHVGHATGSFVSSVAAHTIKAPVALIYNITNGLHNSNAHFFNDSTVRERDNITGIASGLQVGAKELGYGMYDAFTGLVTQPVKGYQEKSKDGIGSGLLGAGMGVGKGLGGLVFKSSAAIMGIPGYGLKGLEREIEHYMSGSDAFSKDSLRVLAEVRAELTDQGLDHNEPGSRASNFLWSEAKGAGSGKHILQRRVWQGYRELRLARKDDKEAAALLEEAIIERWAKLAVPSKLVT